MKDHNARLAQTDSATRPESFEEIARDMQRILRESNAALREINAKLDALMKHLGVPYEKSPSELTSEEH